MRRVLVIARHFPPLGGAGVHRPLGTVRHLPDFGYEPVVVTGPGERADRWGPRDAAMLGLVGSDVEVHRLEGPEPGAWPGWWARPARLLERPPPWVRWWAQGAGRLAAAVGSGCDVVLASLNPYETAASASHAAAALGLPWVGDLEDPWALDEMRVHPTRVHHLLDIRRMRRGLQSSAAIIMNTPEAARGVRALYPSFADRPVEGIGIGIEPSDFTGPAPVRDDGAFRIVHAGALHTALGRDHARTTLGRRLLGGTSTDVDILARSHVHLLDAVDRLRARRPEDAARVEVHLAGVVNDVDREVIGERGYVRVHGRLPHEEIVALMRSADLLFLPMHDLPEGRRAGLIPYKTYEYLSAGAPILAAVPDGDARDLLGGFARVSLCRPTDAEGMAVAIGRLLDEGVPAPGPGEEERLAALERRRQVARIAAVLDEVLDGPPAGGVRPPAASAGRATRA
jgi:glycosyltransferase involved in cell wall biosynthesis